MLSTSIVPGNYQHHLVPEYHSSFYGLYHDCFIPVGVGGNNSYYKYNFGVTQYIGSNQVMKFFILIKLFFDSFIILVCRLSNTLARE